jgi:hypothetical protein
MPDNTRTITDNDLTRGNAPADALFGMFKQNADLAQYAAKKDIDTGAALKLNKQKADDATALATLHQKFNLESAKNVADIARQQAMESGTAINALTSARGMGLSAATGHEIPGITTGVPGTTQETSTGETGGAEPQFTPNVLHPLAAAAADKAVSGEATAYLTQLGRKADVDMLMAKDTLHDSLNMMNSSEQEAAKNLANDLRLTNPGDPSIRALEGLQAPGGKKADYYAIVKEKATMVDKAKNDLAHIKAMGEERLEYGKTITGMKTQSAELIAKMKQDGQVAKDAMKNLVILQGNVKAQLASMHSSQALQQKIAADPMSTTTVVQNAIREYAETGKLITEQEAHLRGIEAEMIKNNAQTTPNPPSDTEKSAVKQRIGANAARSLGLDKKDPEKWTETEKAQFEVEVRRAYNDWTTKAGAPKDNTQLPGNKSPVQSPTSTPPR